MSGEEEGYEDDFAKDEEGEGEEEKEIKQEDEP